MADAFQTALAQAAQDLAGLRAAGAPLNETNTKGALIEPRLAALGWNVKDQNAVYREWRGNDRAKGNPVDYALFPGPRQPPALLVEAKPLGQDLEDIAWIGQTTGHANTQDVAWCVLTDGAHSDVYKAHARGRGVQKRFFRASLDDLPSSLPRFRPLGRDALIPPLLERAWEERELRVKVQAALEADRADLNALARRLRRSQALRDLDPKQVRRGLRDLLAEAPASQAAAQADIPPASPPAAPTPDPPRRSMGGKAAGRAAPQSPTDGIPCVPSIPGRGQADGRLGADLKRMILLEGSLLARDPAGEIPAEALRIRQEMATVGALKDAGAHRRRLRRDWPVGSPSTAAPVVRGASLNGWILWRLPDGRTIDSLRPQRTP